MSHIAQFRLLTIITALFKKKSTVTKHATTTSVCYTELLASGFTNITKFLVNGP